MSVLSDYEARVDTFKKAVDKLNLVDLKWHLQRAAAMERCILAADPIKGSTVVFTKEIVADGTHNHGWMGAKDHLKVGCLWKVHNVEVNSDGRPRYGCLPAEWEYKPNKSLYYHDASYVQLIGVDPVITQELVQAADSAVELLTTLHVKGCIPAGGEQEGNLEHIEQVVHDLRQALEPYRPPAAEKPAAEKLLPCPMCGSDAEMVNNGEYWPRCTGNKTMAFCLLSQGPREGHDGFTNLKDAVTVWNRRVDL